MKPLVIYHANCLDGFCAAWVVHLYAGESVDYQAVDYQSELPDVAGRVVLVMDFSFLPGDLTALADKAVSISIHDHHKTAIERLAGFKHPKVTLVLDPTKSGARLAWDSIFQSHRSPWLVDYVEDRDLWRHALPDTKAIHAYLSTLPYDFRVWDELAGVPECARDKPFSRFKSLKPWLEELDRRGGTANQGEAILHGETVLRAREQQVRMILKNAFRIAIDGHLVPTVNSPVLQSELGHELCQGHPFAVIVWADEEKVHFSLRSDEGGIDVSEVAKKYGGGGHKHAAGFALSKVEASGVLS